MRKRQRFGRDPRGSAALEFAIVFPVLMALLSGALEYSLAARAGRRLTALVDSVGAMLAATPVAAAARGSLPATTGTATYVTLHYAHDSAMLVFPDVLADAYAKGKSWGSQIKISMAGVSFTLAPGCTSASSSPGCYVAHVGWTGDAKTRACGAPLNAVANSSTPSASTLPMALFDPVPTQTAGVYAVPPPVIVVDVVYTYTPLVFGKLLGSTSIARSAYVNPRYMTKLTYQAISGDDGFGQLCPGGY
jgi:Flp pilus assembly protein TadG